MAGSSVSFGDLTAMNATESTRSPGCVHAWNRERTARFEHIWQPLVTPMRAIGHDKYERVAISHTLRAAYIYNPKAAHNSVLELFQAASGRVKLEVQQLPLLGSHVRLSRGVPAGYLTFTFVRDPISAFLSGYAEAAHRMLADPSSLRGKHSEATTYDKVACEDPNANMSRFVAFLDDTKAGRRMGYDSYHVWPQVMKLDVLPDPKRFDFVGRVETLREDWQLLLHHLGVRSSMVPGKVNSASHNVDNCGRLIAVPRDAVSSQITQLCDLLSADFVCFGYRLPPACRPAMNAALVTHQVDELLAISAPAALLEEHRVVAGMPFFNDREYQMTNVPPYLRGAIFLRTNHTARGPLDFSVGFKPGSEGFSVWLFWNTRLGREAFTPQLRKLGFVPAGEGPSYNGSSQKVSRMYSWVYHHRGAVGQNIALHLPSEMSRFALAVTKPERGATVTAPSPLPASMTAGLDGNIGSLRALSEEVQEYLSHHSRGKLASHPPVSVELANGCAALYVPFNGTMFAQFEAHLRTFGPPAFIKSTTALKVAAGSLHSVVTLDTAAVHSAGGVGEAPFIFRRFSNGRMPAINPESKAPPRDQLGFTAGVTCTKYEHNIWKTWLAWILGELRLAPKVIAAWLVRVPTRKNKPIESDLVMEGWESLPDVLLTPTNPANEQALVLPGPEVADHLLEIIQVAGRARIHVLDLKPNDVLLRRAFGGSWEVRITDFDRTGFFPFEAPIGCSLGLTLPMLTALMACGPARHTNFVQHFVRGSLALTEGHINNRRMRSICLKQTHNGKLMGAATCLSTDCPPQSTAAFVVGREVAYSYTKDTWQNDRQMAVSSLHEEVVRMLSSGQPGGREPNWTNSTQELCPANCTFDPRRNTPPRLDYLNGDDGEAIHDSMT